MRNEAARFVTLIDALYEHKVKLLAAADAEPPASTRRRRALRIRAHRQPARGNAERRLSGRGARRGLTGVNLVLAARAYAADAERVATHAADITQIGAVQGIGRSRPAQAGERYLFGPVIDFLCLGGSTLLLLPIVLAIGDSDNYRGWRRSC